VSDERHEQGDATPDAGAETTVAGLSVGDAHWPVLAAAAHGRPHGPGAKARGAAAVIATTRSSGTQASRGGVEEVERALRQHVQHLARKIGGDTASMAADYAEDALVHDRLFAEPFVGRESIARCYASEVASVPDRALRPINRKRIGDELVVEWEATGTRANSFLGLGGRGNAYTLRGVTTVVRRDGTIVRERHSFDRDELLRQIEAE
jgi:steroid delta-isomerase-like uncharacterized protein